MPSVLYYSKTHFTRAITNLTVGAHSSGNFRNSNFDFKRNHFAAVRCGAYCQIG